MVTEMRFLANGRTESARLAGAPSGFERGALWEEIRDLLVNFDKRHPSGEECG